MSDLKLNFNPITYSNYSVKYKNTGSNVTSHLKHFELPNYAQCTSFIPITFKGEPEKREEIHVKNAKDFREALEEIEKLNKGKYPYDFTYLRKEIILDNDIDLSVLGGDWQPIEIFTEALDGRGHKISGLKVKNGGGLFNKTWQAEIKDLILEGVDIKNNNSSCVGALAGELSFTQVSNCQVTGTIQGNAARTGGLTGYLTRSSKVSDCIVDAEVSGGCSTGE